MFREVVFVYLWFTTLALNNESIYTDFLVCKISQSRLADLSHTNLAPYQFKVLAEEVIGETQALSHSLLLSADHNDFELPEDLLDFLRQVQSKIFFFCTNLLDQALEDLGVA